MSDDSAKNQAGLTFSPEAGERCYVIPHSLAQQVLEYIMAVPSGGQPAIVPMRLYKAISELKPLDAAMVTKHVRPAFTHEQPAEESKSNNGAGEVQQAPSA